MLCQQLPKFEKSILLKCYTECDLNLKCVKSFPSVPYCVTHWVQLPQFWGFFWQMLQESAKKKESLSEIDCQQLLWFMLFSKISRIYNMRYNICHELFINILLRKLLTELSSKPQLKITFWNEQKLKSTNYL